MGDFNDAIQRIRIGEDVETAASALLQQLNQDEKLWLLDGDIEFWKGLTALYAGVYSRKPYSFGAIPRLNIPGAQYVDGPRGVNIGQATAFPVPMARGATWDPALETRVGEAIGLEARAMGANLIGSVCINLPRHPAWGRVQECWGEDPLLLGDFGVAHIRGLSTNVMACVKHFALNSMELARFRVNVLVDEDALHEVYLPHFRRCAEEGAACFMTAYNAVNGAWAGDSKALINDLLYDLWKYKGFTISDWVFGSRDAIASIKAGLTLEAPFQNTRSRVARTALCEGRLTWSDIEIIGHRLLSSLLRHYAQRKEREPATNVVLSSEHRRLAKEVATRSIVLLKNDPVDNQPVLPLATTLSSCAVIGRLANSERTGDSASSMVDCPFVTTPYQGVKNILSSGKVLLEDSDSVEAAVAVANSVDAVILVVGYNDEDEGEYLMPSRKDDPEAFAAFPPYDDSAHAQKTKASVEEARRGIDSQSSKKTTQFDDLSSRPKTGDRKSVRLRANDVKIIKAVAAVNSNTIVSIVTAGAVIIEEWRHLVNAIVISWYNGCEAGSALASVLFGFHNASGRLPWSMARDEAHLPSFSPYAREVRYDKWFGQRLIDRLGVTAAYPLGWGISFTTFSISQPSLVGGSLGFDTEDVTLRVTASNIGSRDGFCVLQIYGRHLGINKTHDFAPLLLLGFRSIEISAQAAQVVDVQVSLRPMQQWVDGRFIHPATEVELLIGQFAGDPSSCSLILRQFMAKF